MFNQEGGLWGSTAEGKLLTSAKIFTPQASKRLGMGDNPPVYLSSMRTCVPVHACRWASNLLFVPKGDTTPFYVLSHASWLWYNGETPFDSEKERPPSAFQSYRNGSKLAFLDGLRLEAGGLNTLEGGNDYNSHLDQWVRVIPVLSPHRQINVIRINYSYVSVAISIDFKKCKLP